LKDTVNNLKCINDLNSTINLHWNLHLNQKCDLDPQLRGSKYKGVQVQRLTSIQLLVYTWVQVENFEKPENFLQFATLYIIKY